MRKLLLLFTFVTLSLVAFAQDPVVSITTVKANQKVKNSAYFDTQTAYIGEANSSKTWSTYGFSNNNNGWDNIRCGSKGNTTVPNTNGYTATFTTDFSIAEAINKVTVELGRFQTGNNNIISSLKLLIASSADMTDAISYEITDVAAFTALAKNGTTTFTFNLTTPKANQYYQIGIATPKTGANGVCGLLKVEYYGEVQAGTVAAPIITLGDNNMVTISQEDGGETYYTTNGDTPSTASTPYNAPFAISGKTTVKAIAYVDGEASPVTSKTLTPNTVANIAKFINLEPTEATKINAPVTAIYQNGRNLYIKDADDNYILAYNDSDLASIKDQFTNGDVISFISGTYKSQNGLPEMIPTAVGEKTSGTAVEPNAELNISDIDASMLNQYVTFENVSITAQSKANTYTMADADGNEITIFNTFSNSQYYNVVEIPEGEGFTVTGFVSCYSTTIQITPISVTGGTVMETVATPVINPEGGDLTIGDKITITCATEGASIYYTTEDETPDATSIPYTGEITFSEAMTIRAIAIKDGMLPSDVATATFTVYDPNKLKATFDFTNATTLTQQTTNIEAPAEVSTGTEIGGKTFTEGYISMTVTNPESGSSAKWFYGLKSGYSALQCRLYSGCNITVSAIDNYTIKSIVFTQDTKLTNDWPAETKLTVTTNVDGKNGSWSDKEWTAPESENVTTVSFTPAAKMFFSTMTVTYGPSNLGAIDDIFGDADANAPVEYYNLQGIRVAADNLTPGFYVVRQGSKTAKVLIRK